MSFVNIPTRKRFKQFDPTGTEDLDEWKRRFLETRDPTEYAGAIELVGSWDTWQYWKAVWPDFKKRIVPKWLAEMEIMLRSEAIRAVALDALSKTKTSTSSAKWIAEGNYKPKPTTKEAKKAEADIKQEISKEVQEDLDRVFSSSIFTGVLN